MPTKLGVELALENSTERAKYLIKMLEQSEHAKNLVGGCANELESVNAGIKKQLHDLGENTAAQSEPTPETAREVSESLAAGNSWMDENTRDRTMSELRLAAATEQTEGARHAALHDVLTGLPNRALFNDRLEHGIAQAARHGWTLAVMFVDLDDFKKINDSHGHDVGDRVLQTIARRLKENTRVDDTVSRYGGDEFLYLLLETADKAQIASIAEKIIEMIQAPCYLSVRDFNISLNVNASIGISIFPTDGSSAEVLVKSADSAMYRAKQTKSGFSFAA